MEARGKAPPPPPELLWDLVDRLLLPIVFSHAAAVILSTLLNVLGISKVSTISLFIIFVSTVLAVTLFYHNLKVRAAGKCVLVTGCDSRIGSAITKYLDELGFTVFAGFQELGDASRELKEACSGRVQALEMDPTSEQSVHAALSFVINRMPQGSSGLWAVINAACLPVYGEVEWIPYELFHKSAEVNLFGAVRVTQIFLPLVRANKGRIVNVSSIQGKIASGVEAPLCVAKSGMEAFSDCLRLEMRRWGVDVVVIEPGHLSASTWYDNDQMLEHAKVMWQSMSEESRKDYGEDYFERKIRAMKNFKSELERDVGCVVKCVADAVTRTFPLPRYTPVSRSEKLQSLVAHHLPRSVYNIIYH